MKGKTASMEKVEFIAYDSSLAPYFKELNVSWLRQYFVVEPIDEIMLSDPQTYIIDKGGYIFFARLAGEIVGTFAFVKTDGIFELGKMAVSEKQRGKKIGNQMLDFCLARAKQLGMNKLFLYSNTKLENAIYLYRKYGFTEVPFGSSAYKRSNIKMEVTI